MDHVEVFKPKKHHAPFSSMMLISTISASSYSPVVSVSRIAQLRSHALACCCGVIVVFPLTYAPSRHSKSSMALWHSRQQGQNSVPSRSPVLSTHRDRWQPFVAKCTLAIERPLPEAVPMGPSQVRCDLATFPTLPRLTDLFPGLFADDPCAYSVGGE